MHTFDTAKWSFDSENHWHPATCAHTDERDSIAPHNWNDGVVTTPANYGTEGVKTYTCTVCRTTRIEAVPALDAKNNVIAFADGLALDKTYDGEAVILSPEQVLRQGDGAITVMYKEKDANDNTYAATAPTNAGEYTVKAIVEATAEWKGGSITADFTIEKRTVTLPSAEFDGEFAENLASGKFGLACINVAEDTNNVVTWVTICVPEEYYAIGIHTISVDDLSVDNDNFMLATGEYASVRFTVWDAPAFYAGIKDIFSFASGDIVITTEIARGTLHKGDSLHINELGKIIKVTGITKNKVQVDTATAGDAVDLRIEGVKKEELSRGFMLSEPDTVVCYGNYTITIRLYTKDEGGQHTPIFSGITPQAVFDDTFFETICTVTFPEDNTMFFPGETREGVTVDFQGKKLPGFVGRRFKLKSGGKTIAECIITALTPTTNVTGNVIAPEGKTVVIDPIEKDATAFAINLNRSTALAGITETEAVNLLVKCDGKVIGRYSRSGLGKGELPYVENGGTMAGSYIRVNLEKNISALTDADGKWISEKGSVTFEVTVERTEQLGNLNIGTTQTISLQNGETRYYTINNLANLADGWYSFVNCFDSGKCRYEIYTGEYVKDEQMHDMFRSSGGAYVIKYTANKNITDEIIGVNAAKAELPAINATASLTIPTGKKGDRLIIKVTLYKALTYHHSNYVKFEEKVAAFNGSKIKVFKNDYSVFNGMEYASLPGGDRFKLPNRNNERTVAYIMMEYGSDLNSTTTLNFYNQTSTATELPEPKSSDTAFREVTFNANAPLHFYFKVSTPGKYRIDIVKTDSIVLVPTISTKALYNPVFDEVTVNHTQEFTAGSTGWYSLTLQNTLNTSQKVRIRIVKVS